ncbi:MAG: sugar transferase [Caldilineaceae bacterium]
MSESSIARLARHIDPQAWKYLLAISDSILILVGFFAAYYLRYQLQWFRAVDPVNYQGIEAYLVLAALLVVVLMISFRISGVYPYKPGRSVAEETYTIATATTTGVMVLIVVSLIFGPLSYSRLIFLYTAMCVTILLGTSRTIIFWLRVHLRHYGIGVKRSLLVGMGDVGRMVIRTLAARPDYGYQLVGFLDDNPTKGTTDIGPFRALGSIDNLAQVLTDCENNGVTIDTVMICLPWQSHRLIQRLLRTCETFAVTAQVVPDFFQVTHSQIQVETLDGIPLISSRELSLQGWNLALKRGMDLLLITIGLVAILPIALLIAFAIKLDSPGPVLYQQKRVGKNGKQFTCYKFRSMIVNAEEKQQELANLNEASGPLFKVRKDPRLTRVGRILRRHSLDEIPQLINVVRGEMSLIGPRPNLPSEVQQYQEWHKKRLFVPPGLTGLWQISGRSDLTFDEMVLLDIYYVENWSPSLDTSILIRSVPAVLLGKGAY